MNDILSHPARSARSRTRSGNAAVEFALIAPVAMLMLVGVTDYGMAVYDRMQLSSAVRAGIQYAMHHSANPATIEQVVMSALTIDHSAVTVTAAQVCECPGGAAAECDETCADGARRTFIRIDATQQHDALFTYPGISNPTTLQAQAFVRIQ
jgi:Flp pilus assembly protein TadG